MHQYSNVEECLAALRKRYEKIITTHLSSDAMNLYDVDFTRSIALIFGNEHSGVSKEIQQLADGNFIIPQVGIIQSLNISVACAVSLYEAFRQKKSAGHYESQQVSEAFATLLNKWGMQENDV